MSFFTRVLDTLFPPRAMQLLVRDAVLTQFFKPRIVSIDNVSVMTLLPYRSEIVQACVVEAKYHKNRRAQALLGAFLADYIKVWLNSRNFPQNIVILPLPLGKMRRKDRGYNQTEEIGCFCVKTLGKTSVHLDSSILYRARETVPQTTLGRKDRKANMRGAFGVSGPINPSCTYLLLDDVVTTGATLLGAYEALKNAGATSIFLIALAH